MFKSDGGTLGAKDRCDMGAAGFTRLERSDDGGFSGGGRPACPDSPSRSGVVHLKKQPGDKIAQAQPVQFVNPEVPLQGHLEPASLPSPAAHPSLPFPPSLFLVATLRHRQSEQLVIAMWRPGAGLGFQSRPGLCNLSSLSASSIRTDWVNQSGDLAASSPRLSEQPRAWQNCYLALRKSTPYGGRRGPAALATAGAGVGQNLKDGLNTSWPPHSFRFYADPTSSPPHIDSIDMSSAKIALLVLVAAAAAEAVWRFTTSGLGEAFRVAKRKAPVADYNPGYGKPVPHYGPPPVTTTTTVPAYGYYRSPPSPPVTTTITTSTTSETPTVTFTTSTTETATASSETPTVTSTTETSTSTTESSTTLSETPTFTSTTETSTLSSETPTVTFTTSTETPTVTSTTETSTSTTETATASSETPTVTSTTETSTSNTESSTTLSDTPTFTSIIETSTTEMEKGRMLANVIIA
ncbi:hypothetical protein BDK51DRAFT_47339, partial [Blyttiomyces helicus]